MPDSGLSGLEREDLGRKEAASSRRRHVSSLALKEGDVVFGSGCCFCFKQKCKKRCRLHMN